MNRLTHETLTRLKEKGFRLTGVRKELVEFILSQKGHWDIQSLNEKIKAELPKIGIATVYRTVHLLMAEGILAETKVAASAARYEVASSHHHDHLTCLDCGKIFEFENEKIESLQKQVAKSLHFELRDHRMELYGKCVKQHCKNK